MPTPQKRLVAALLALFALVASGEAAAYSCPQSPSPPRTETYRGFLGRVYELDGQELPYRLYVPENYDPAVAYPLVLYLHHAGLAGSDSHNDSGWDNCVQLTSEIGSGDDYGGVFTNTAIDEDGKPFQTQERYPHFLLAPHAESPAYGFGGGGEGSASGPAHPTRPLLMGILDDVQAEFNIDPGRLYVTGISMGCYGTWDLIMRNPEMFAAASPQSCRGDPDTSLLAALKDMPIWSMCGTNDSYFDGAQAMADGMEQVGATAFTFTAMQGVGHSINDRGYDYPGFVDWMFAQRLESVPPADTAGSGGTGGMTASTGGGFGGESSTGDQATSAGGISAGGTASMATGSTETGAGGASSTLTATASMATASTGSTGPAATATSASDTVSATMTNSTASSVGGGAMPPGVASGESEAGCACHAAPIRQGGWSFFGSSLLVGLLLGRRRNRFPDPDPDAPPARAKLVENS